ncbi:MAG: hypothetical protein IKD47_04005 [Clostridia bacterium]|nr:hypothetical protein [Clostridia bacterium]
MRKSIFKTLKSYIALLLLPALFLLSGCIDFSLLKYPKVKNIDDGFIYNGAEYVFYMREFGERGYALTGEWDTVARGVRGCRQYPIFACAEDTENVVLVAGDGYDGIQPAECLKKDANLPLSVLDCEVSAFIFLEKNYRDPIGEWREGDFPLYMRDFMGETVEKDSLQYYFRYIACFRLELRDYKNYITSGTISVYEYNNEELYLELYWEETRVFYEIQDEYQAAFRAEIQRLKTA